MKNLDIRIIHSIPGRIRLRLKRPPRNINEFIVNINRHDGIEMLSFNPLTLSLLVLYQPSIISATEIVVRASISLSIDYEGSSVEIRYEEQQRSLTALDYYAASSILFAFLTKTTVQNVDVIKLLEYNAGASTLAAVLRHAWSEIKREGIYDPEVISVVYLFNALVGGNYIASSAITWMVTFGRHMIAPGTEVCVLEASQIVDTNETPYTEVMIKPVYNHQFDRNPIKIVLVGLSRIVGLNPHDSRYGLMEQIQQMSRKHGNVLEGIGKKPAPVYMRLNQ